MSFGKKKNQILYISNFFGCHCFILIMVRMNQKKLMQNLMKIYFLDSLLLVELVDRMETMEALSLFLQIEEGKRGTVKPSSCWRW